MATFIPGVTDYIPQFQNDIPDLGLIQQTLKIKQSQYDANFAKIKSIQDSILNAQLTRDDTKETRKAFFEAANKAIKQISTVDLSKPQNVSVAERIFDPLINNQLFLADASKTKIVAAELQKGYDARECADPKKCNDGYNPESEEALNYWLENFKNMTPEEALKASPKRYVYDPKVSEKLLAYVKEIAPDGEVSEIAGTGEYIITTKMGQKVQEKLNTLLQSMIANDPQVAEYFTNKAYVARERYVRSTATPESGISREQANKQYDAEKIAAIQTSYSNNISSLEEYIKNKKEESNALAASQGNKIKEGSPIYEELKQRSAVIKQYEDFKNNITRKKLEFDNNVQKGLSSSFIDNNYADQLLESSVSSFTEGYAAQKYSKKIEANDIWLNEKKFEQDVYLKNLDLNNQIAVAREKARLDAITKQWELDSGYAGGKGGKGSKKTASSEQESGPQLRPIESGTGSNVATKVIKSVNYENTVLLKEQQQFANGGKYDYLVSLSSSLDQNTRNVIFAKPGGGVYTHQEVTNLLGPNGLQRAPNNPSASMLGIVYGTVKQRLETNPVASQIPSQVYNNAIALQNKVTDMEEAVKLGLDVITNNNRNTFAGLQNNPEYIELAKMLQNNPDLSYLVKSEKKDGKNILVIDEVEMNKKMAGYEGKLNPNEAGLSALGKTMHGFSGIVPKTAMLLASVDRKLEGTPKPSELQHMNLTKDQKNFFLLENVESILTKERSKPNNKQTLISSTNFKLDELGNPTISFPAVGYNQMILNTSNSEATGVVTNFFQTINNKLAGKEPVIVTTEGNQEVANKEDILSYLSEVYQNPDDNNPQGILGISRVQNLNEENEYTENAVTYTFNIPNTLKEKIRDSLGKDSANMEIPSVMKVTVPSDIDRELTFGNKAALTDPITQILNLRGNYTKVITNPANPNTKVELKMYKNNSKDIIVETWMNGVMNPNSTFNLTQNNLQPTDYIDNAVTTINQNLLKYNGEPAKSSGQINEGTVYNVSDLKSQGLIF